MTDYAELERLRTENLAQQARIEGLIALLREGESGFGRILIATGDDTAVWDWQKRVRTLLSADALAAHDAEVYKAALKHAVTICESFDGHVNGHYGDTIIEMCAEAIRKEVGEWPT